MKKSYVKRTVFWDKVADSLALVGGITTGGIGGIDLYLASAKIPPYFLLVTGGITVLSMLVKMWNVDEDKDGKTDLLENEEE